MTLALPLFASGCLTLISGPDHDAADGVVGNGLVRRGRIVERIRFGDGKWPKLTGLEVGCHLLKAPRRVDDSELCAVYAEDSSFVVVQVQQVDFDRSRTDDADHHEPAPKGQRGQRGWRGHATDGVIHHVDTPAIGEPLDLGADICRRVERDEVVDDSRGGGLRAGPTTVHSNHFGAERSRDLRHRSPYTTGNPEDGYGFAGR